MVTRENRFTDLGGVWEREDESSKIQMQVKKGEESIRLRLEGEKPEGGRTVGEKIIMRKNQMSGGMEERKNHSPGRKMGEAYINERKD